MCDASVDEDTDTSVEQWSLGNIPVEVCGPLNLILFSVRTGACLE
jgi:hypothetical protein